MTESIERIGSDDVGKKVCLLFSGQGSQYRQMGCELYDGIPLFSRFMDGLDQIVRQETGTSILSELYGENRRKSDPFDQTRMTHPAIFMVQLSLAQALMASGVRADTVLGSSLGEYVAAVVVGAVDGESMMRAIIRSANIIERQCAPGSMMSVLAPQELYHEDPLAHQKVTFVGSYLSELFVVAGQVDAVMEMHEHWEGKGIVTVVLPVSHAFHSDSMDDCSDALRMIFSELAIENPKIPFYSSVLGGRAERLAADHFLRVGREPIHFVDALMKMVASSETAYDFIDVGPFGSLAGIVKQKLAKKGEVQCFPLLSPFANSHQLFEKLVKEKAAKAPLA
jgi:trans-AT polyketide synthase, acyltransferase and oxidoreductase domains